MVAQEFLVLSVGVRIPAGLPLFRLPHFFNSEIIEEEVAGQTD